MKTYDIIYVCDNNIHSFLGGTEASVKIILEGQCPVRKVAVIQPGKEKRQDADYDEYNDSSHIYIKGLFKHPWQFFKYILFIRSVIKENPAKIIHVQAHVGFFIIGFLLETKLIRKDFRFIYTDRGLYTKYNAFFKKLFLHYMKYADYLVTTTEFNQRYWMDALSGRKKCGKLRYKVIENTAGVEYSRYDRKTEEKDGSLVIGFAGRFCHWKNWPLSEEICLEAHKRNPSIEVRMAVAGNNDKDKQKVREMFERIGVVYGDRFRGNINVPFSDMDPFYEEIDVFILTSDHNSESFGRTLVEAMSRKTAILLTDAGGAVEVVSDEACVCGSAEEFCEKIMEMDHDRDLLKRRKERNYARVKKVYSLGNNIEKHMRLYEGIENEISETG